MMKTKFVTAILCFLYSLSLFARVIVVSDIDDTLKKANSVGKPIEQAWHFLRKVPYLEMRDLFTEIKNHTEASEDIKFYYVSAAPDSLFDADAWINKHHFPKGISILKNKKNKAPTYEFKHKVIMDLLEQEKATLGSGETLSVIMFGDNAQFDAVVYKDLTSEMNLDSKIYIRDVRAEATVFDQSLPLKKLDGVSYYFSEVELLQNFDFVSNDLLLKTYDAYKAQVLIPAYTYKTLYRRLHDLYHDKKRASDDAAKFWNDYYSRF